jgi:hopene-associated glycosyltransferase HpnB
MALLAALALLGWLYLVLGHGRFWQAGPMLVGPTLVGWNAPEHSTSVGTDHSDTPQDGGMPKRIPPYAPVAIVVPARDEAATIERCLASLLAQDYPAPFRVVLVDDGSSDGTGAIARALADPRLTVIDGAPRPAGWAGKLWAVSQGVRATGEAMLLLTDADIVHEPGHLATLVSQAERTGVDMVSEMVALNCESLAERLLVPAFVYFFQLLYPFAWVNDGLRATAAAAGGTVLIRRRALDRIGGIDAIRGALIDDVALATAVKRGGRIWLGHSTLARSIRPYPEVADIWRMVTRSAYVQLRTSPVLLVLMTLGLALIFLVPPLAALFAHHLACAMGLAAWLLMAASFIPTLRRFRLSWITAPLLPPIAAFYMAATIASAADHHRGRGVQWKRRAYTERSA